MTGPGPLRHGGEVFAAARARGCAPAEILDFSASINPLGLPAGVERAVAAALPEVVHYPEIAAASLVEALAEHHSLPAALFLPGNGSTELIYLLPRVLRPRRAVLVTPAFGEYARALTQVGCVLATVPLAAEAGFRFDPEVLLAACDAGTGLVVVANPGNPGGSGIAPEALLAVADGLPAGALLLVDEAFVDFCPHHSLLAAVATRPNLCVLRSLTKFYAIPGLRAGYLAASREIVRRLAAHKEPWTLSTPAIAAARACLAEEDYRRRTLQLIPQWRQQLADGLANQGLTVFPACANYLLLRLPPQGPSSGFVARVLYGQGILVRDCSDFAGLDDRYLRVAVRGVEENLRLLTALKGVLLG